MLFPHCTDREITIDGSWHGDERQLRFTGTVSSSAPFVILSLLRYGDERHHYTKHKSDALEVPLNLYQGKFPHQNRTRSQGTPYAVLHLPAVCIVSLPEHFLAGQSQPVSAIKRVRLST
jgi:hypothetical protein